MFLTSWDPFDSLEPIERVIDRFAQRKNRQWTPSTDIWEEDEHIYLSLDLPGLKQDEIQVEINNGTLNVRGERQWQFNKDNETRKFHHRESFYGSFHRAFYLPESVDPTRIEANYSNGVLLLSLPKSEKAKPRQISVQVK